jgi:endoglucanase
MVGVIMAVVAVLAANPFEGRKLYVDPYSPAAQQAAAWRETRPQDAAEMDEIATAPQAQWFGDWNPDVAQAVDGYVSAAAAQGRWTLLVAYNLPARDCGGHSAGHSAWHPAATMASRLRQAGIGQATGFSLNVSNFRATAEELAYGRTIAAQVGKHFVIDTGRNGLGPNADEWCNPPGRALGPRPTTATGDSLVDAFLWIKQPGFSDGPCNGGPAAGAWWADYALGLARRSM